MSAETRIILPERPFCYSEHSQDWRQLNRDDRITIAGFVDSLFWDENTEQFYTPRPLIMIDSQLVKRPEVASDGSIQKQFASFVLRREVPRRLPGALIGPSADSLLHFRSRYDEKPYVLPTHGIDHARSPIARAYLFEEPTPYDESAFEAAVKIVNRQCVY